MIFIILLLGNGIANQGVSNLLTSMSLDYVIKEINEVKEEEKYDLIVKSPGISLNDPVFSYLKGEVVSDLEIVYRLKKPNIILITGTNAKTTITKMLEESMSSCNAVACGNIGYSFAQAVLDHPNMDYYLVEASSFQLEATKTMLVQAYIVSNITMTHLDHHGDFENYVNAKLRPIYYQNKFSTIIYNKNMPYIREEKINSRIITFSNDSTTAGIYRLNNDIYFRRTIIYHLNKRERRFPHYVENLMAVLATLVSIGRLNGRAISILKKYKCEPFRLQMVRRNIYNDSKSTNPASTNVALRSLEGIHLICGGKRRGTPIILEGEALRNLVHVYSFGDARCEIEEYFIKKCIPIDRCTTIKEALALAISKRNKGEVILFSPMYPSFDEFTNYIERGQYFNEVLKNIIKSS